MDKYNVLGAQGRKGYFLYLGGRKEEEHEEELQQVDILWDEP